MPSYRDDDDWDDEDDRRRARSRRRGDEEGRARGQSGHSTIGILSLLAALLSGVLILGLVVVAGVMAADQGDIPDDSPEAIVAGLGIFAGVGVALVGLILGVIGLTQRSQKLFPILGTAMNGLVLLGTLFLICVGLLAG